MTVAGIWEGRYRSLCRSRRYVRGSALIPLLTLLLATVVAAGVCVPSATAVPVGDPIIAAAGDIACGPGDSNFNQGKGTQSACQQTATSDLVVDPKYSKILVLGDTQYDSGGYFDFMESFDLSWGRVKQKIAPAVGNHEYNSHGALGYWDYFNGFGQNDGPAGPRSLGYYSFDVGNWHLIALNSECSHLGHKGCTDGSTQERWLAADLASHRNQCTLAYWHKPRFSSGPHGNNPSVKHFWNDLYAAGADIVLNGHDHHYERFGPQTPQARPDPRGIREFVVGTGGKSFYASGRIKSNSEVRQDQVFGVLALTLHRASYDWQFIPIAGEGFTDSGSAQCHNVSAL